MPDAFGNIITESNSAYRGSYAWTGREIDVETNLQYNRARWYDPATSRWMSQDPLGFDAGDSNLYRYVKNTPTTGSDPSGLASYAVTIDPDARIAALIKTLQVTAPSFGGGQFVKWLEKAVVEVEKLPREFAELIGLSKIKASDRPLIVILSTDDTVDCAGKKKMVWANENSKVTPPPPKGIGATSGPTHSEFNIGDISLGFAKVKDFGKFSYDFAFSAFDMRQDMKANPPWSQADIQLKMSVTAGFFKNNVFTYTIGPYKMDFMQASVGSGVLK